MKKTGSTFYMNNRNELKYFNVFRTMIKEDFKNISDFYKENIKKYVIIKYIYKLEKVIKECNNFLKAGVKSENIHINFKDDEFFITPHNMGIYRVFNAANIEKFEKSEMIEILENIECLTKYVLYEDIKKYIIENLED